MAPPEKPRKFESWLAVIAFVGQGAVSVYAFGQSNAQTAATLTNVQLQLAELKGNQVILNKLVTDVAVIQERQSVTSQELAALKGTAKHGR